MVQLDRGPTTGSPVAQSAGIAVAVGIEKFGTARPSSEHDVRIVSVHVRKGGLTEELGSTGGTLRALWHLLREYSTPLAADLEDVERQV